MKFKTPMYILAVLSLLAFCVSIIIQGNAGNNAAAFAYACAAAWVIIFLVWE